MKCLLSISNRIQSNRIKVKRKAAVQGSISMCFLSMGSERNQKGKSQTCRTKKKKSMKFIGELLVFVFSPMGDFPKQAAFAVCVRNKENIFPQSNSCWITIGRKLSIQHTLENFCLLDFTVVFFLHVWTRGTPIYVYVCICAYIIELGNETVFQLISSHF